MFVISEENALSIARFLLTRPFGEVHTIMAALQQMSKTEKDFRMSQDLRAGVFNYLSQLAFKDVAPLIDILVKLTPVQDSPEKPAEAAHE